MGAGEHQHAGVHRPAEINRCPPLEQRVDRKAGLHKKKIGILLPIRQRCQLGGNSDPEAFGRQPVVLAERPGGADHRSHAQVVRPAAGLGPVAVHEEQLADAIRSRCQKVTAEAEDIAVPGVQAGDGAATHLDHFMSHGDAGDCGPTNVVVRHEERRRDGAQHADLVAHPAQVRSSGGFDLADHLECPVHHAQQAIGPSVLTLPISALGDAGCNNVGMLDHLSIQCANVAASAAFYDAVLAPLGGQRVMDFGMVIGYGIRPSPFSG